MDILWYTLVGAVGGILGGMGMGGGTVLIPLLSIFCSVSQHTAQAINLVSFIPMAIVALIIHLKNKLIEFKYCLWTILSGVLFCIIGCFLAKNISSDLLKRLFGVFLIFLSIFQIIIQFKEKKNK
jgi:uncharacterized membrane protein YfcA